MKDENGNGRSSGRWEVVYKVSTAVTGSMLAWGVWVTTSIYGGQAESQREVNKHRIETIQLVAEQRMERDSQLRQLDEKISKKLDTISQNQVELRMDFVRFALSNPVYPNPHNTNRYTIP